MLFGQKRKKKKKHWGGRQEKADACNEQSALCLHLGLPFSSVSGNTCGMDKRIQGNRLWGGRCCWYAKRGHQEKKCELFFLLILVYLMHPPSSSGIPLLTVARVLGVWPGHCSSGEWHCWNHDDVWIWGSKLWDWPYCRYNDGQVTSVRRQHLCRAGLWDL